MNTAGRPHVLLKSSNLLALAVLWLVTYCSPTENAAVSVPPGNACPESKPWPCRTPNICLSFALICDGEADCPDGYDEDEEMCLAKSRPPEEHLQGFINRYRDWLIPNILGEGKPNELATKLIVAVTSDGLFVTRPVPRDQLGDTVSIESKTIVDYVFAAKLKPDQIRRLIELFDGIKTGKQIAVHMMGMPLGAWSELYWLFHPIYLSGFLDNVYELPEAAEVLMEKRKFGEYNQVYRPLLHHRLRW